MSEEIDYSNAWREKWEASLARGAEAARALAESMVGRSFLIVTEGEVTEPVYFDLICKGLKLSMVRVKVMPGWASDPRHVIKTAAKFAERQQGKKESDLEIASRSLSMKSGRSLTRKWPSGKTSGMMSCNLPALAA
jgi:hypothetical protein